MLAVLKIWPPERGSSALSFGYRRDGYWNTTHLLQLRMPCASWLKNQPEGRIRMQSLWNEQEAAQYTTLLSQRVYTSRLLGRDQSLVMHGGGNTSVKIRQPNIYGEMEEILYVKGSGWD